MTKDKRTKFNQYVIIGGSLGILTGFIFLAVILLTSPTTDVPINAYYNPSPSGRQPWLGCSSTLTSDGDMPYIFLPNGSMAEMAYQEPYVYYPDGTICTIGGD